MKKLLMLAVIAAFAFSSAAWAELELSANVTSIAAFQMDSADAANYTAGGLTQGDFTWAAAASDNHFGFVVDQAELDVENEFGENIMARFDVDFWDETGTFGLVPWLEQGYITANIAIGNGMEFLLGKFDAPTGLESIDRWENVFSTYTPGYMYLRPVNLLGAKLYYEFNDHWSFDLAAVNSLNNDVVDTTSDYPAGLFRLGAKWGEEGNLSFIHLAAMYGHEWANNSDADLFGNLWGSFALSDNWDLGLEVTYRTSMIDEAVDLDNMAALGGQLYAVCEVNDVWTIQGRAAAYYDMGDITDGATSYGTQYYNYNQVVIDGAVYSGTVGATYTITDGAKMKMEYRLDYGSPSAGDAPMYHTVLTEFGYSF